MKREVVRDFLNLPGIAGVALMDGRSRPYFCGVDQTLNFQQKEALAQGIRQVVETTPDDFESFEFQFTGHQVYIYKLAHGIILLVLARSDLVYADYQIAIDQLKVSLLEDISTAIATFRLFASDVTLSGQNYWKNRPAQEAQEALTPSGLSQTLASFNGTHNATVEPRPTAVPETPSSLEPPSSPPPAEVVASTDAIATPLELKELLLTLNHLSQFTTQYLGTAVITNYWKSSQPQVDWLNSFQIDRSAKITFSNPAGAANSLVLTPEQHQWVRDWVAAFIERCAKVIRDFPTIVDQKALDERQKQLLL